MKRVKRTAFVLMAVLLLTACGRRADGTVKTEEIVVPEMSSEDLLVDSLEYLLRDDVQEEEDIQEQELSANHVEIEEEAAEFVEFVVYYSNGTCDGLNSSLEKAEEMTAEAIVSALARHNIVSLDTKVLSFREEEEDAGRILYLDLSAQMNHYLDTMTREAKDIIIDSIARTFLENYKADSIHIQIAGKPLYQSEMEHEA